MAIKTWNVVWVVTPCGLVGGYRSFGGKYRLHLQGTQRYKSDDHTPHCQMNGCSLGSQKRAVQKRALLPTMMIIMM
jgi:hypothetical protein